MDAKVFAGQYVYRSQLVEREDVDVFATMDMSKYRKSPYLFPMLMHLLEI